jgi:aryl-alcohol dehydrogenase-like predicted oxidoreductase
MHPEYMGACDQKQTEEILDFFYSQGGNFIDTSNNYQFEESEKWIGEWMKKRDNRDQMGESWLQSITVSINRSPLANTWHLVIATKYTTCFRSRTGEIAANFTGNGTKSLHTSVNASLKKLQTDYIDLVSRHHLQHHEFEMMKWVLTIGVALRALVGFQYLDRGSDAGSQCPGTFRQGAISRNFRHASLGRRQR